MSDRLCQICANCVTDTTDSNIVFDEKGSVIIVFLSKKLCFRTGIRMKEGVRS